MKAFRLELLSGAGGERFDDIVRFIGADDTGSFGLLAGHAPFIAVLRQGLARFQDAHGRWRYLALAGGVLRFRADRLSVATVRYFLGEDRSLICRELEEEMSRDESDLHRARATMDEIEFALLRRLERLSEGGSAAHVQ